MKKLLFNVLISSLALNAQAEVKKESNRLKNVDIERIIVTGSRVKEGAYELTSSVSIINEQNIQDTLQLNSELQNMLTSRVAGFGPNLGTTLDYTFNLRGRSALVMIDGVPQKDIRSVDASALQRIEVIKGSTSIYGRGASGGIVNYITKEASDEAFSGSISAGTKFSTVSSKGSFDKRYDMTISGTVDDFSYVINGVQNENGQQKDATGDIIGMFYSLSDLKTSNLFTKVGYQLTEDKSLGLTYNYYDAALSTNLVNVYGDASKGIKTKAVVSESGKVVGLPTGPTDNYNIMFKYVDEYFFDNTTFTFDLYSQKLKDVDSFRPRYANTELKLKGGQLFDYSKRSSARATFNSNIETDNTSAQLVYGIDYLKDDSLKALVDGRSVVPETKTKQAAAYLQTKLIINDNWVVRVGIRTDKTTVNIDDYLTIQTCRPGKKCSESNAVRGGKLKYNATTFNGGLRYNKYSIFSPFINYSQSYDSADIGRLLRYAKFKDVKEIPTEASKVKHMEIGFSSTFDKLQIEAAAYQSKSDSATRIDYNPETGGFYAVKTPEEIWGGEVSVQYTFNDQLSFGTNFTKFDGKDESTAKKINGRKISPTKFVFNVDYQPTDNLSLSIDYRRIGSRNEFSANTKGGYKPFEAPVKGYELFDFRMSYKLNDMMFSGGIENLLNEDYMSPRAQSIYVLPYPYIKSPGRTATLGMKYSF